MSECVCVWICVCLVVSGNDTSVPYTVDQSDGRSTDGESSGSVVDACRGGGATVPASRRTMKERYVDACTASVWTCLVDASTSMLLCYAVCMVCVLNVNVCCTCA